MNKAQMYESLARSSLEAIGELKKELETTHMEADKYYRRYCVYADVVESIIKDNSSLIIKFVEGAYHKDPKEAKQVVSYLHQLGMYDLSTIPATGDDFKRQL